jgi:hypothetical protein
MFFLHIASPIGRSGGFVVVGCDFSIWRHDCHLTLQRKRPSDSAIAMGNASAGRNAPPGCANGGAASDIHGVQSPNKLLNSIIWPKWFTTKLFSEKG